MLSGVCIGTNDVAKAGAFYDAVLGTIGMTRAMNETEALGYAGRDGRLCVYVVLPGNEEAATVGNGMQVTVSALDAADVRAFHAAALAAGGTDEGAPGPRPAYHPDYYGAYVRDLDGNKLHVCVALD